MAPIETPRLLLRLPEVSDAGPFMAIMWDPEVVANKQVTLVEEPGDIELARKKTSSLIDHWQSRGYGLWTVVDKASGEVIGTVGLQKWKGWPDAELAWVIHRDWWGRGLASEAASAALAWAWANTTLDHIISIINVNDTRSMKVATKVGEQFERADVDPINGEPVHIYGVYRSNSPTTRA
jgi:RimJ/RimL family protein N-acetyltransferase